MPRRPSDEQTQKPGDSVTDTQATDTTQQPVGTFSAELDAEPIGDDGVNNPNIINR